MKVQEYAFVIEADCVEDALGQLLDQVRKREPDLSSVKAEFADGSVATLKLKGKPPKRHPLQVGPTVTTGRRA